MELMYIGAHKICVRFSAMVADHTLHVLVPALNPALISNNGALSMKSVTILVSKAVPVMMNMLCLTMATVLLFFHYMVFRIYRIYSLHLSDFKLILRI